MTKAKQTAYLNLVDEAKDIKEFVAVVYHLCDLPNVTVEQIKSAKALLKWNRVLENN